MKDSQDKLKSQSSLSKDLESKPAQATVKSLLDIRDAILSKKKVWITLDGKEWVYVELKKDGSVWINFGMTSERRAFRDAIQNIHDFLSFKRSTDLL